MENKIVVLDVGTTKIACLIAEVCPDESLALLGYGTASPGNGLRQGNIVDISRTTDAMSQAVRNAEQMADFPVKSVNLTISGAQIQSFNQHGKINIHPENREITRQDIEEAVNAARNNIDLRSNTQLIHDIPQEFVVDGHDCIENPIGMVGTKLDVSLHSVAASATTLRNLEKCCDLAHLNIVVDGVVFKALASGEAILTPDQKKLGGILVELGGGTTDLIVYVEGKVVFCASLPFGGEDVTLDIAKVLKIPTSHAETLKISYGGVLLDDPDNKDKIQFTMSEPGGKEKILTVERSYLRDIIYARIEEIFEKVQAELKRVPVPRLAERLSSGVFLSGGGAKMAGIDRLVHKLLGLPVQIGAIQPLGRDFDSMYGLEYATALGLLKYAMCVQNPMDFPGSPKGGFFAGLGRFFKRVIEKYFGES